MQNQEVIRMNEGSLPDARFFDSPEKESFRANELLAGISEDAYAEIERKIETVHYLPHEIVFHEDELGECLYLIAQGSVEISKKGRAGKQEILAHLMEQDFFGEMALVDRGQRSAQAAAVGHTVLGRVDTETWDLLLHLAPHEVLNNFTRTITKRLRRNNQNFIEHMMRAERLSLLGTTISSIAHDLNNPIASILGACEAIQTQDHDPMTVQFARIIRDAVDKMQVMTRELIDFSRGNTSLNLHSITVDELVRDLKPAFARCGPQTEVRIEADYHDRLVVDRHRILRVFENLIRNARESMKKSSRRELRFSIHKAETHARFEISDTGSGIPKEILPRIFEPFVTHGKANGTGLGLAISKAVVKAHRGTISVASDEKGTTFRVDLPLPV